MKGRVLIAFVAALAMAGCASTGNKVLKNETAETVAAKIHKGKTTKDEVRAMFGGPLTTSFTDNGNEIWKYEFTKAHAKAVNFIPVVSMFKSGSEGTKKELTIFFDSNGIVKNYTMSTSKVETDTGWFQ